MAGSVMAWPSILPAVPSQSRAPLAPAAAPQAPSGRPLTVQRGVQEHATQGGCGWSEAPSFGLPDLAASLAQCASMAASQASTPWPALQDLVSTVTYGAGLGQRDRAMLRALAAEVLDGRILQSGVQRVAAAGGLPLGSTPEAFRCARWLPAGNTRHALPAMPQCRGPAVSASPLLLACCYLQRRMWRTLARFAPHSDAVRRLPAPACRGFVEALPEQGLVQALGLSPLLAPEGSTSLAGQLLGGLRLLQGAAPDKAQPASESQVGAHPSAGWGRTTLCSAAGQDVPCLTDLHPLAAASGQRSCP